MPALPWDGSQGLASLGGPPTPSNGFAQPGRSWELHPVLLTLKPLRGPPDAHPPAPVGCSLRPPGSRPRGHPCTFPPWASARLGRDAATQLRTAAAHQPGVPPPRRPSRPVGGRSPVTPGVTQSVCVRARAPGPAQLGARPLGDRATILWGAEGPRPWPASRWGPRAAAPAPSLPPGFRERWAGPAAGGCQGTEEVSENGADRGRQGVGVALPTSAPAAPPHLRGHPLLPGPHPQRPLELHSQKSKGGPRGSCLHISPPLPQDKGDHAAWHPTVTPVLRAPAPPWTPKSPSEKWPRGLGQARSPSSPLVPGLELGQQGGPPPLGLDDGAGRQVRGVVPGVVLVLEQPDVLRWGEGSVSRPRSRRGPAHEGGHPPPH